MILFLSNFAISSIYNGGKKHIDWKIYMQWVRLIWGGCNHNNLLIAASTLHKALASFAPHNLKAVLSCFNLFLNFNLDVFQRENLKETQKALFDISSIDLRLYFVDFFATGVYAFRYLNVRNEVCVERNCDASLRVLVIVQFEDDLI